MDVKDIRAQLCAMRDEGYSEFANRLIPGMTDGYIIGVRTPALRAMARNIVKAGGYEPFLAALPHNHFEENLLHAFILSYEKSTMAQCVERVERFLPYIDNWAVCDQFVIKRFADAPEQIYPLLKKWMASDLLYTRRFAVVNSMRFFLDGDFRPCMLDDAASAVTDDYYMQRAVAWYFATALAKQYDTALPYIAERRLPPKVHAMAVRKAIESLRIDAARKTVIKSFR